MPRLEPADRAASRASEELGLRLDQYRVELTGYCYRMRGSAFDADDAVQETLVRAWRSFDRFEGRASLRSWLYRIATNVCFSMLHGKPRRARPMDLVPPATVETLLGKALPADRWIQPVPDARVLTVHSDPAELVVSRETIRLAFIAALQQLAPRQRAVLILRDVLRWRATEVADLLEITVASVNSIVQRARSTLAANKRAASGSTEAMDSRQRLLLARYIEAFERYDIESLVSLLRGRNSINAALPTLATGPGRHPPMVPPQQSRLLRIPTHPGQRERFAGTRAAPAQPTGWRPRTVGAPNHRDIIRED